MKIENQIIDTLYSSQLPDFGLCHISNSIIKKIDFISYECNIPIIIESCIIHDFLIHSCWFREGISFRNNQVINYIDYQMGGHNNKEIEIVGNIFHSFLNFFDCYFTDLLRIESNHFLKGTNIIGNVDEAWKNVFEKGITIKENIGLLDMNGIGEDV